MKFDRLIFRIIIGVVLLYPTFTACTRNDMDVPEKLDLPIRWNIQSEQMANSRVIINDDDALKEACTPNEGGTGKAIGIWSAYDYDGVTTEHVLGKDGDVSLTYRWGTSWDNHEGWTYGQEAVFWKFGAVYHFNAYFPMEGGMTSIANTKTSIQGNYDTETTQTDLMVTRVSVDTNADSFAGSPVALPMKHALATLRFNFMMDGGDATSVLKSFSLDNTLKTSAYLNYDTDNMMIDNWVSPKTSPSTRIYEWADNTGVSFSASTTASPYTIGTGIYCTNGGHVLIIPQNCAVPPTFTCTVGTHTYNDISIGTKQFEPGKNYIFTIKVKENMLDLTLSIKAWNELDSSYDITF